VTAAETLARFATELTLDDIPAEVLEAVKLHLLDTLGCGLAAHAMGVAGEGRQAMAELGGEPQATVIGLAEGLPGANAAFANAMLCHGLDFDDTHSESICHVSAVTCPAALAAAEAAQASGRETLTAIVAADEIVTRLGMAAPSAFHARGFHPTAVCGVFGAAAAAAVLSRLDHVRTASALGIAGSMAAGLFAYLEDGTATKPIHPAWAAHGGVLSARLSALGAEGPPSVIEGKFGLYHAFLGAKKGEIDIAAQLTDLGDRWETPRIAFKPYPACHFMHGALGATAEATAEVSADEIEEITVTVPSAGVSIVLEPVEQKVAPRTEYEGKFSLQYSAAAMAVHGRVGNSTYTDEALTDERVLEMAKRVRYEARGEGAYPSAFGGGATVRMRDGRILEADHPYQLGSEENPMSADDVIAKFRDNAAPVLDDARVDALRDAVLSLEQLDDLEPALALLAGAEAVLR
jgi:2-methylcitrate dehydratase PrpD